MLCTPVPEASVYQNSNSRAAESYIDFVLF
jgi:hypothetical protein